MMRTRETVTVVGGGLAGTEAAWQLAQRGIPVRLYEMRPHRTTPAHVSGHLAELVCSNSLGSDLPDRAPGVLKAELRRLGSVLMAYADQAAVPAGGALAVDREVFARQVTGVIASHPLITLIRKEVTCIPAGPCIIASGPLTAANLANDIAGLVGEDHLFFYDAVAPTLFANSIDMSIAFRANRYGRGKATAGDYINCPLNKAEYERFVAELSQAKTIVQRDFEREDPHFFEGCLPVEQIAVRGMQSLAFGPMRPVGLNDPRTGRWPYAVVQLRQDNLVGSLYNMVGFQTNLRWGEQKRVFRMIPGLEQAEFARYGQMHRNTFINAPRYLDATLRFRDRSRLFFAGQITGVEGYVGNIATGLLAGLNMANVIMGRELWQLPSTTMLGALCHYISHAGQANFQPMKANFGVVPPLADPPKRKRQRKQAYAARAETDLEVFLRMHNFEPVSIKPADRL
jgi:methylenetetrahydrofolate--tRNA-(uracil-5-)-methyltransferase